MLPSAGPPSVLSSRPEARLGLRWPLIMMVIAATAIPVELRPMDQWTVSFDVKIIDVLANLVGYAPVGILLAGLGFWRSTLAGSLLSLLCEVSQIPMVQRSPSGVDLVVNTLGTALGALMALKLGLRIEEVTIRRWMAIPLGLLYCALLFRVSGLAGDRVDPLADSRPGELIAHWQGRGPNGPQTSPEPTAPPIPGGTAVFDGIGDFVDLGKSRELQITHSLTITGWINPKSFPSDDAPIASDADGMGYQLDTSKDTGPRTVGFKLSNACGEVMSRYGATPLKTNTWYHVAGVYDAEAGTIHVYLNGKLDDGIQAGQITNRQRQSRTASSVYLGRRSGSRRFYFAGRMGDIRIYSRALSPGQIEAIMNGADSVPGPTPVSNATVSKPASLAAGCTGLSEDEDAQIPPIAAASGALLVLILATVYPPGWLAALLLGAGSGVILHFLGPLGLPVFNAYLLPLAGGAGGAVIAGSIRRGRTNDQPERSTLPDAADPTG